MLTIDEMLNNNNINDINNVSLKLYKEFFSDVLCNMIFEYLTIDNESIKIEFKDTQFMHILGAQHILGDKFKASKFNEQIDNGKMTFEELSKRNQNKFKDDLDRFLGFSNIYYVLTNCDAIYFDKQIYKKSVIPNRKTSMDFKYILFQDSYSKKLHLGLDTFNKGRNYYVKSLLVTSELNDKYLKNQKPLLITNIKVIDRRTKEVLHEVKFNKIDITEEQAI